MLGLIGDPIEQSLSPLIFNHAFAATAVNALYAPLPGAPFDAVVELAASSGVTGLSVTMPYKQAALEACATATPLARRIGAVNTMTRDGQGWRGDNTDGPAVVAVLEAVAPLAGARCAILGAGGAARAAAVSLLDAGVEVTLFNRTAATAEAVAESLGCRASGLDVWGNERFDVLVNATSVGMDGTARTAVSTTGLKGDEVVLDMVYRPLHTRLLQQARERGCRIVSGLEMFLHQATFQYEEWIGEQAPAGIMRTAAEAHLRAELDDAAKESPDE